MKAYLADNARLTIGPRQSIVIASLISLIFIALWSVPRAGEVAVNLACLLWLSMAVWR